MNMDYDIFEEVYVPEAILGKKILNNGQIRYKVKWAGFGLDECTWVPIEQLYQCNHLIDNFEQQLREEEITQQVLE